MHRPYPYTLLILGIVLSVLINWGVWYALNVVGINFPIEGNEILSAGLYMFGTIVWYCIIFTTDIGFSGEWKNNTLKNAVSYGVSRNVIFFGKCIMHTVILLVGLVIISGVYLLANYICFRNDGSLTADVYQDYFYRFALMLPLTIAGQMMASALCMFFNTDLLWCGIYAIVIAFIPNGAMLFYTLFPEVDWLRDVYIHMPTVVMTQLSFSQISSSLIERAMWLAAIMFVVPTVVSLAVFHHKEIK